jgi:transposase
MAEQRLTLPHSTGDRALLERWVRSSTTPQRVVWRSRIILLALDGHSPSEIAGDLGLSHPTVRLWLRRFASHGPSVLLHDASGRGRRPSIDYATLVSRLREANLLSADDQPTRLRDAAQLLGVSVSTVWRILNKPDRES